MIDNFIERSRHIVIVGINTEFYYFGTRGIDATSFNRIGNVIDNDFISDTFDFNILSMFEQVSGAIEECKYHFLPFLDNTEAQYMEVGPRRCSPGGVNSFIKKFC